MPERAVEKHLVNGIKRLGGMCLKFISPGMVGVPDRLIITAKGEILFAEVKTDTGRLSKTQQHVIAQMRRLGVDVRVVRGLGGVKELLAELDQKGMGRKGGDLSDF